MRNCLYTLLLGILLLLPFSLSAQTETGADCDHAIRVTQNLSMPVSAAGGSYWFKIYTYDLPLRILFVPSGTATVPVANVDFTCTPGVYDNPLNTPEQNAILTKLFSPSSQGYTPMPMAITPKMMHDTVLYEVDKEHTRDLLAMAGLTGDIWAFVQVEFTGAGSISMSQDTVFRNCMNSSQTVEMNQSAQVFPNDSDQVYVLPFGKWQNDSLRITWLGKDTATVAFDVNGSCNTPWENMFFTTTITPGQNLDMSNARVNQFLNETNQAGRNAGLVYLRVASGKGGVISVSEKPMDPPESGTVLMAYDSAYNLRPSDTTIFAIACKDWQGATRFTAQTAYRVSMQAAVSPAALRSASLLDDMPLSEIDSLTRLAELTASDMQALCARATGHYIYLRFTCKGKAVVTPTSWEPTACESGSTLIKSGVPYANKSGLVLRMRFSDFKNDTLKVSWTGAKNIPMFVLTTCQGQLNMYATTNVHYKSLSAKSTVVYTPADIAKWKTVVNPPVDGYYYVRFNNATVGDVTFTSIKHLAPEPEPEPEYCSNCGTELEDGVCHNIHCPLSPDYVGPEPGPGPDPQPTPSGNLTIELGDCSQADMTLRVTMAQTVHIFDNRMQPVTLYNAANVPLSADAVLQPGQTYHFTPLCGIHYTIHGRTNTIHMVR